MMQFSRSNLKKQISSPIGKALSVGVIFFLAPEVTFWWLNHGQASVIETGMTLPHFLELVIPVLFGVLAALITYRQMLLQRDVRESNESLCETNRKLRQEITERQLTREALETSEKKYFTLFNNANDIVIFGERRENSLSYRVVEVNDAACRIIGYPREILLSRDLFEGVMPGSTHRLPLVFDELERNDHVTFELDYLAGDGRVLPLEMNAHRFVLGGKTVLMAIGRDVSARKKIEYDLRESLAEKDVLLREVHHRVKNNLQVIISLLDLESCNITDPFAREHFRECQNRIRSMALVHQNLYQSRNFSTIRAGEYIRVLVDHLAQSCGLVPGITLQYDLDEIDLDLDTAIPCGFVINELVTNAFRHAFAGREYGTLRISLKKTADLMLTLIVEDDGSGFPEGVDFQDTSSLGLQIVTALSRQLEADVSMERVNGTRFVIQFSGIHGKIGV
ncbi:MAG: histidine kinase dimerization/phosphoacceptor domain -containing protein [Methanoregulaceae archaeon]